jgi:hypothetical protein
MSYKIFDAVRSKITNGDIGSAVEQAFRDVPFYFDRASNAIAGSFAGYDRPSAIYKPTIGRDGNMWIAVLGDNLQEGVVGVGETPDKAMADFDKNWFEPIKPTTQESGE